MQISTRCAICETLDNSIVIYPSTVTDEAISAEIFSARRLPDRKHYRWVKCLQCNLFRSDPVSSVNLDELYEKSTFDYSSELHGLKNSYRRIVLKSIGNPSGKSILEIGGGNGFFLEEALKMGFESITEVEPSQHAYINASEEIKKYFVRSNLKSGIVKDASQDIVVAFHVLDHLTEPAAALTLIQDFLKPGGVLCLAVHNIDSISAKLLKSKSPIFDVEHTYLYSKKTLKKLLAKSGYVNIKVSHYKNSYSLAYLVHLLPISRRGKSWLLNTRFLGVLKKSRVTVPLGNMWAYAEKLNS